MLSNKEQEIFKEALGEEWYSALLPTLQTDMFHQLGVFLHDESVRYNVLPHGINTMFRAFRKTPLSKVYILISGQNPYHTPNVADGLAFSCGNNKHPQPSLKHILMEVEEQIYGTRIDMLKPEYYDLSRWARQGVLLLNAALSVREGQADSHMVQWDFFTKAVFDILGKHHRGIVYMLWGVYAKSFIKLIPPNNYVLTCGHPMTKSYGNDTWSKNGHFAMANIYLKEHNNIEINW